MDAWRTFYQHHFEFAVPLALFAWALARFIPGAANRIMPIFFGVALAPLFAAMTLDWEEWLQPFPNYLTGGIVFDLTPQLVQALYLPGWGICAVLALLHPLIAKSRPARRILWIAALLLMALQVHLVFSSTELR